MQEMGQRTDVMTNPAQSDQDKAWRLPGWAHFTGAIELGAGAGHADSEARQLVVERVARYCWAYDERRDDLLADCFTDDGIWEGNVLDKIEIGPFETRKGIVDWLTGFWPHQHDQRRHMLLNNIVESLDATSAVTFSYLLLMANDSKQATIETTGFYRCEHVKQDGVWRIARMTACFDSPFWPGDLDQMSSRGRRRHGILED